MGHAPERYNVPFPSLSARLNCVEVPKFEPIQSNFHQKWNRLYLSKTCTEVGGVDGWGASEGPI